MNLEIAFLKATKEDEVSKMNLSRGEFLDFVVRLAYFIQVQSQNVFAHRGSVDHAAKFILAKTKRRQKFTGISSKFEHFIKDFFDDPYLESEIMHDRRLIRSSRKLNALLSDNIFALEKIFLMFASDPNK
mmetsp:Transcript_33229/g.50937  ORF Transcript_33229/g.50937 Transcript_33229/m.50937 type:complete len:130 (+) Transcript_33229:6804-7193(+)